MGSAPGSEVNRSVQSKGQSSSGTRRAPRVSSLRMRLKTASSSVMERITSDLQANRNLEVRGNRYTRLQTACSRKPPASSARWLLALPSQSESFCHGWALTLLYTIFGQLQSASSKSLLQRKTRRAIRFLGWLSNFGRADNVCVTGSPTLLESTISQ